MTIKVEDLLQNCPSCEGTGRIAPAQSKQGNRYGTKVIHSKQAYYQRRGKGSIPAESGKAILELIRKCSTL